MASIRISGIVTKEKVYFPEAAEGVPSTNPRRTEVNISFDTRKSIVFSESVVFVKMVCKGKNWYHNTGRNYDMIIADQTIVPDWYTQDVDKYEKMVRAAFAHWFNDHVGVNESIGDLNSSCYLLKNCRVSSVSGNAVIAYAEDSVIETMGGSSTILNMVNTEIQTMGGTSKIFVSRGASHIYIMTDASMIHRADDETEISSMTDHSYVHDLVHFASIGSMSDDSEVFNASEKQIGNIENQAHVDSFRDE